MKIGLNLMAAALLVGAPCTAQAASIVGHLTSIQVYPSGQYAFRFGVASSTSSGCSFYYAETGYSNYQALVAAAMTAFSTGKSVAVDYNPGQYCSFNGLVVNLN